MSDILVTSPYRPFTLPNQFKALFNGYVYCGTVDAVDPSNSQVQVYKVNEDGSRIPVAQPLRTNAGGFLVYNGQPAKFVTDSNHSLLVRDSLGAQLWYAPDVSIADPDTAYQIIGSQAREALRRSYAEAGYNLVDGSFEIGGTINTSADVLLHEAAGEAYSWGGALPKVVPTGSSPATIGGVSGAGWLPLGDITLRAELASKGGVDMVGGDLASYGADKTGVTSCDTYLEEMLADGVFIVTSGTYLISTPHTIDVSLMDKISIGPNVEFLIRTNINGLSFKNVLTDVIGNNMRITVDIPGGGYSGIALELRGTKYFAPPSGLGRLTNKTQFGPFYVFNKQGTSKQEVATAPVMDEGYGFSIDCNSSDEQILIWNSVKVSSTGFTTAHSISVGTNPLNFISSLDLDLVAWFSTYHFRDSSQSVAGGNVAAGIGDVRVRLQSQPHPQMVKVVHMEHAPGYMGGCRFDLSIWDANVFGYRAGVVDASKDNEYSNTLERYSYPLTRALDVVDSSLFPVVNYRSGIQESDVVVSSDPELAKYVYLSTVTPSMTILEACNAIKEWCNTNGVKHTFEFRISLFSTTADIKATFLPWLSAIGDDAGTFTLKTSYYDGVINSMSVVYELDMVASGGRREVHEIMWTNKSGAVTHKLVEYSYGTTAEIKAKATIMLKGFTTYDTILNIPVWFNGSTAFLKADGSVAYPT